MEIEDREYIERAVSVIVSVAIRTAPSSMIQNLSKGPPFAKEAAHRELVARITATLSNHFEMGQIDTNSGLYITNYAEPREPHFLRSAGGGGRRRG